MPVYKISREDRCKILNTTAEKLEQATALIDAQAAKYPDVQDPATGEMVADPRGYLSWYDALKMADPEHDHGKYHFIVDNGHHDHDSHHTMTFSRNVAEMLRRDLGVEAVFVDKVEHHC